MFEKLSLGTDFQVKTFHFEKYIFLGFFSEKKILFQPFFYRHASKQASIQRRFDRKDFPSMMNYDDVVLFISGLLNDTCYLLITPR